MMLLTLFALLYFLAFLAYPLFFVTHESFFVSGEFTIRGFTALLSMEGMARDIGKSLFLCCSTTLTSITLGTLCAFLFRIRFHGKKLYSSLLFLPLIIPPFIGAVGIQKILARFGPLNLFLIQLNLIETPIDWIVGAPLVGIILIQSLHFFPLVFFAVNTALDTFDHQLIQAASITGARNRVIFYRVLLPLLSPALFATGSLIAIGSLTDVGTPLVFEYRENLAVRIYEMLNESAGNPVAYALVLSTALMALFIFLLSRKLEFSYRVKSKSKSFIPLPYIHTTMHRRILLYSFLSCLCFVSLIPHLSMVLLSISTSWSFSIIPHHVTMRAYENLFSHPLTSRSITISVFLSAIACLITACGGLFLGSIIDKKRRFLSPLFDFLVMLPIAVPGIIIAFGYFGGFAGTILDPRNNPFPLLAIGYSIRRLPYVVRNIVSSLSYQPQSFIEAAKICGASNSFAFKKITLKLLIPSLTAGLILCFSYSMIEVSESLLLALSEKTYPIAKAMYALISRPDGVPLAAALGVLIMGITLMCSFLSNKLMRVR